MTPSKHKAISTPEASDCVFVAVDVDSTTTMQSLHSEFEQRGLQTEEPPSLTSLIAYRRKLLTVVTVQLGIVCFAVIIARYGAASSRGSLEEMFANLPVFITLSTVYIATLIVLHCARTTTPLNWIVLTLLTVCDAMGFIMLDIAFSEPFLLYSFVYVWWIVAFMLAGAGWTKSDADSWWRSPSIRAPSDYDMERKMVSPAVPGFAGLLSGLFIWGIITVLVRQPGVLLASSDFWIVVAIVVFVCGTFCFQLTRTKAPHEFMRGVIYLHLNILLVFLVLLGFVIFLLATVDFS